jgi:hypothetical protein
MMRKEPILFALIVLLVGCSRDPYAGWEDVVSAEHKFKVKMPGTPEKSEKKMPDGRLGTLWDVKSGTKESGGNFGVTVSPSPIPDAMATKEMFDFVRDKFVDRFKGKLVKASDVSRNGKIIGRDIEMDLPGLHFNARAQLIMANGMLYQLGVMGDPSWHGLRWADRFFKSFELVD